MESPLRFQAALLSPITGDPASQTSGSEHSSLRSVARSRGSRKTRSLRRRRRRRRRSMRGRGGRLSLSIRATYSRANSASTFETASTSCLETLLSRNWGGEWLTTATK